MQKKPPKRNSWIAGTGAYQPGLRNVAGTEAVLPPLYLDANEGRTDSAVLTRLAEELINNPALLCTYPSTIGLEQSLAARYGVASERVVVCTGADDAIQRVISYCCSADDKVLAYDPAFAMYEVYTRIRGGLPLTLPWYENDAFPQAATLELLRNCPSLALVCLASPANPVGNCINRSELEVLAEACAINGKSLLLDTTYEEFSDSRPGGAMAQSGLCYVVGTFSKAWGLAGLRVGWVIAPDAVSARCLRAAGGPYPASGPAIAAASFALQNDDGLNQLRADIAR
ncbi:MAG: aminotransferase class I/II-fold pyridoxal phosphate-dependent enzyme, partial [Spirochaetes bacterium]|nr:aminotransferase class I/II-fold pyridoxal phosphate-dependent enzyme [Spirochaetota bacterium]